MTHAGSRMYKGFQEVPLETRIVIGLAVTPHQSITFSILYMRTTVCGQSTMSTTARLTDTKLTDT
jgi:hypothetical protein